jgi:hypothetical protein
MHTAPAKSAGAGAERAACLQGGSPMCSRTQRFSGQGTPHLGTRLIALRTPNCDPGHETDLAGKRLRRTIIWCKPMFGVHGVAACYMGVCGLQQPQVAQVHLATCLPGLARPRDRHQNAAYFQGFTARCVPASGAQPSPSCPHAKATKMALRQSVSLEVTQPPRRGQRLGAPHASRPLLPGKIRMVMVGSLEL